MSTPESRTKSVPLAALPTEQAEDPGFQTADRLPRGTSPLVVAPEITLKEAARVWNAFLAMKAEILADPACFDIIEGKSEMNRTGATRLALPFGLSIEQREVQEGRVELADSGEYDYRYRVTVRVSKGGRYVDGVGSCRLSEITTKTADLSKREHFALTKAWTRATKRAIGDILGGTEAE